MHRSVCLLVCVWLVGCAAHDERDVLSDSGTREALISFVSDPARPAHNGYSAFDGNAHVYRVMVHVPSASDTSTADNPDPVLASSLVWSVEDAFVKQEADAASNAEILLTTKQAGTTTIDVSGKRMSGALARDSATLEISRASADEWNIGEQRYSVGEPNDVKGWRSKDGPADKSACGLPGTTAATLTQTSACGNCHDNSAGITAAPTPEQTAGYSDDDLIRIFTQAWKPPGYSFTSNILTYVPMPDCVYQAFHTWEIDDASKHGLVWKMRSLKPSAPDSQRGVRPTE